jgi:hypothetical protein
MPSLIKTPNPPKMREQIPIVDRRQPQWVSDMHAHYVQNGHYRSEDLHRVLGDPRSHVGPHHSLDRIGFAAKK